METKSMKKKLGIAMACMALGVQFAPISAFATGQLADSVTISQQAADVAISETLSSKSASMAASSWW